MFDNLRENFEIILITLFVISAVCYAIYRSTFYKNLKDALQNADEAFAGMTKKERKIYRNQLISGNLNSFPKKIVYFFADLFWVLLFVVVVRGFLYEPFIIPSGSMKPGLQVGDVVLVNKYELGLRMPITNQRLTQGRNIQRGDVLVFKYPKNPTVSYIKRVIGLPGDKIFYDNRVLTVNGKKIPLKMSETYVDTAIRETIGGNVEEKIPSTVYEEDLLGRKYPIQYANQYMAGYPAREWVVPDGQYFVMGDNRDNSADGRDFGLLSDELVIGHATRIALNFECFKGNGKCNRFFKKIL